jgi:glycosyltransferase involved in cell wall biosynthesis
MGLGVNLVGYLQAELGVAEVARQVIGALDTQEIPVLPIGIEASGSRHDHPYGHIDAFENPFGVNLLCVNADQTPHVAAMAGPAFFHNRHTIGLWWWEVAELPDYFSAAFSCVDEVWACTTFVAENLRAATDKQVTMVPLPVSGSPGAMADRPRFGLADETIFLFVFDYHSVAGRKNPIGTIDAYRRAFPEPCGTRLVIKSINGELHPAARAAVHAAASERDDITLIEEYLSGAERDALMASCDCYVSLHRSEGFGLTCAEAMLCGKPVIATAFSGTADFVLPQHSLPVDYELTTVGAGNEPYAASALWAEPDLEQAAAYMQRIAGSPEYARELGERARSYITQVHSRSACGRAMAVRLAEIDAADNSSLRWWERRSARSGQAVAQALRAQRP